MRRESRDLNLFRKVNHKIQTIKVSSQFGMQFRCLMRIMCKERKIWTSKGVEHNIVLFKSFFKKTYNEII
jgi:hypothetical protein